MRAWWVVAIAACKKQAPPVEETPVVVHDARPVDARVATKQLVLELVTTLPAGITARGQATLKQITYTDRAGVHFALFSETETPRGKQLFVDAWLVAPGARPLASPLVNDGIADCGDQLTVAFHDAALDLTDLDHDGLAELTLAYEAGCRREPRGNPYRLVTVAGDKLLTMTGHTRLDRGTGPMGDFVPDAALARAPELLAHARELWEQTADDLDNPPKLDDSDDSDRVEP
jgi:hypothetical protein